MNGATHTPSHVQVPTAWIVWLIVILAVFVVATAVLTWSERSRAVATPVKIHLVPDPAPGPMALAPARTIAA